MAAPQLRDYQAEAVAEIRKAYRDGFGCPLLVASTGAGKTVIFSYIAHSASERGNPVLIAAHRKEIIKQIALSLARFGTPHQVIAPDAVIRQIKVAQFRAFGRSFVTNDAPVMVGSVQTLVGRLDRCAKTVETHKGRLLIVMDECFPAGTLVDGVPIEKLKKGDMVWCASHSSGIIERKRIIQTMKREAKTLCTVRFTNGESITCTENHSFFIPFFGYHHASKLKPGTPIFSVQGMRGESGNFDGISSISYEKTGMGFLQQGLLRGLQIKNKLGDDGKHKQKICICADDNKKPNEKRRSTFENAEHAYKDWAQAESAWREWAPCDFSAELAKCCTIEFRDANLDGACAANGEWPRNGVADTLQDRHCNPFGNDSNRSGWSEPLGLKKETTRREKNENFGVVWVESIEIHQPSSYGGFSELLPDGFVYNIEVEENHNYFANGLLVHNCHHVTSGTQWGAVMDWGEQYQARGLLVTASPQRLDGRGLGRGHGGYADVMLKAPPMSWLIENGYLSPYRVFTTPQVIDMAGAKTRMGEYASADLQERADKPSITGDAIAHWRKHAAGMLTVVFCVSIEHSKHVAAQFAEAGIPSAHIDGCTDDAQRDAAIISFSKREILVLTQVNLVSEGFDLGSIAQADVTIDCIIDLAPTKSLVNAMQRWGRALRPYPGKTAVILDHAGNIAAHGFPDDDREWSLEGTKKAKRGDDEAPAPATKTCPKCYAIHRPAPACPVCGEIYEVQARQIEEVAGELAEVTKDAMAEIRAQQRKQQGRARDLDALVASGVSHGRAIKILQAREEKDALVAAVIAAGAREWKHELRSWKPKQLKEYLTTLKGTPA